MPEQDAAPPRILVIDDEAPMRSMLQATLTVDNEFEVLLADGAKRAQEIVENEQFRIDVILLDLAMPEIDGEQFLEWVKAVAPQIPVLILSGNRTDDRLIRCLAKGAIDFLEKPCQTEQIIDAVNRSIRRQQDLEERGGDLQALYPATDWVELTAPSEMEYLARMQRFSDLLFESRLPKEMCEDLRLAIEELGRNAIEWGNRFDRSKMFNISYAIFDDRIVLKFEDEGEGFNPEKIRDPSKDPVSHLMKRKEEGKRPGGFGLFLMKNIMDEIVYNERGNICVMTKHFPSRK